MKHRVLWSVVALMIAIFSSGCSENGIGTSENPGGGGSGGAPPAATGGSIGTEGGGGTIVFNFKRAASAAAKIMRETDEIAPPVVGNEKFLSFYAKNREKWITALESFYHDPARIRETAEALKEFGKPVGGKSVPADAPKYVVLSSPYLKERFPYRDAFSLAVHEAGHFAAPNMTRAQHRYLDQVATLLYDRFEKGQTIKAMYSFDFTTKYRLELDDFTISSDGSTLVTVMRPGPARYVEDGDTALFFVDLQTRSRRSEKMWQGFYGSTDNGYHRFRHRILSQNRIFLDKTKWEDRGYPNDDKRVSAYEVLDLDSGETLLLGNLGRELSFPIGQTGAANTLLMNERGQWYRLDQKNAHRTGIDPIPESRYEDTVGAKGELRIRNYSGPIPKDSKEVRDGIHLIAQNTRNSRIISMLKIRRAELKLNDVKPFTVNEIVPHPNGKVCFLKVGQDKKTVVWNLETSTHEIINKQLLTITPNSKFAVLAEASNWNNKFASISLYEISTGKMKEISQKDSKRFQWGTFFPGDSEWALLRVLDDVSDEKFGKLVLKNLASGEEKYVTDHNTRSDKFELRGFNTLFGRTLLIEEKYTEDTRVKVLFIDRIFDANGS